MVHPIAKIDSQKYHERYIVTMKKSMLKKILLLSFFLVFIAIIAYIWGNGTCAIACNFINSPHSTTSSNLLHISKIKKTHSLVPVVIIGSGCAGWSAAIYASRGGVSTLVIEGPKRGGQLSGTTKVENLPGIPKDMGPDIMDRMSDQAQEFGTMVLSDDVIEVQTDAWPYVVKTADGATIHALTIVVATGASPRKLAIPGEEENWGKGLTTCAICDAAFHKNKDVIVIGGGDSAVEQVLQLAPYAKTITMIVRTGMMRASVAMQARLRDISHANVLYHTQVKEIIGDGQEVTGVRLYNDQTGQPEERSISGVFLAIGHDPNSSLFVGKLDLNAHGYVEVKGRSQETSVAGIFAAGDIEDSVYRQAGVASGSGIKAALDALAFLREVGFTAQKERELAPYFFKIASDVALMPDKLSVNDDFAVVADKNEFQSLVNMDKPLVVDFYTQYCPSCKELEKSIKDVAPRMAGKATFVKIDAEQFVEIAQEYHVLQVPTVLVFKKGVLVGRYNKKMSPQQLYDFVEKAVC